jgi:predicted DNA-binding helix-hairpin-helix protein
MTILEKVNLLGTAGSYDSCGPRACEVKVARGLGGIYSARAEHKSCRLFKTLMDNDCSFDCKYCPNAQGCGRHKASYQPAELARLFDLLHTHLKVDGLFLSSSVAGDPDKVTERMLESVRLLRGKYAFHGYVHFKVLPGTSYELIKQASELATRLSINIEAPNKHILAELASCKDYKNDILRRQRWISKLDLAGGQTTQLIINDLATDKDILQMVDWEYQKMHLRRVYFSAFKPVKGTPLEHETPGSVLRQHRLYNVDFLMRAYGYRLKEFEAVLNDGMLPREDPKLALARATFDAPVDINEASYEELIRIPGIGPRTARKLITRQGKITRYEQLQQLGGGAKRAKPFIELDGKRQTVLSQF